MCNINRFNLEAVKDQKHPDFSSSISVTPRLCKFHADLFQRTYLFSEPFIYLHRFLYSPLFSIGLYGLKVYYFGTAYSLCFPS